MQNQGRFGLALVCDEIDPTMDKQVKTDEELENVYVTFLSMGWLKKTLVASGDDGFVSNFPALYPKSALPVGGGENCEESLCS